jgi:betaine-aldehyde dehydrogenase
MRHFVNGRFVDFDDGRTRELVDPSTGQSFADVSIGGPATAEATIAAAGAAASAWATASVGQRARALLRLADALEEHGSELADAECRNTGKPRRFWIPAELEHCADVLRFTAGAARAMPGVVAHEYQRGMTSWMRRSPVGVVVAIVPWNFPLMMAIWKLAPILAAGNTCVLKPAEATPVTALRLAELATQVGIPAGVFNVVCGDRGTGSLLVADPRPSMVALTGSVAAGREVAAAAGRSLKRVHLELGGKAAVVVAGDLVHDRDGLDARLKRICNAAMFNAGQSCTAASRVIADAMVYDQVVTGLGCWAAKTKVGPDGDYGPLISAERLALVDGYVARRGEHTTLVTGGHRIGEQGFFYAPTVIADVHAEDELAKREIFGPVITVERAADENDAVRLANGTDYGLAASVWTGDHETAMRVSRQLTAGDVWINTHGTQAAEMPHGGCKQSGYGSDLSVQSILDYTRPVHTASQWD